MSGLLLCTQVLMGIQISEQTHFSCAESNRTKTCTYCEGRVLDQTGDITTSAEHSTALFTETTHAHCEHQHHPEHSNKQG